MGTPRNCVLEPLAEAGFIFGQGTSIQALNAMAADIAQTDIPILITGESGTGKEVYARLIHRLSVRREAPLEKISCTTLEPGRVLLYVHKSLRPEAEHNGAGTLFLDGVDELDLACQRVLLSLLSDGESRGGRGAITPRLISSTTRNLETEVASERFRRELYFRINGFCLRLPPLREREEDIPTLMEYFLEKHSRELKKKRPVLNTEAMELLASYHWPGNIRELENVARKIVALGDAKVALGDLRAAPVSNPRVNDISIGSSLKVAARAASRRTERELILKALERTHWNRKRAAQELQISYKSLLYKIKQIGAQGHETE